MFCASDDLTHARVPISTHKHADDTNLYTQVKEEDHARRKLHYSFEDLLLPIAPLGIHNHLPRFRLGTDGIVRGNRRATPFCSSND